MDHPRSRGVYQDRNLRYPLGDGSSPLARGLPRCPVCGTGTARDHPRSRGVYRPSGPPTRRPAGSSPLARGLLSLAPRCARCARIIPARAGFTGRYPRQRTSDRDHPRSRGVYPCSRTKSRMRSGSSPLARGLRRGGVDGVGAEGIIPARAGFTPTAGSPCGRWPDHPRSRGVYSCTRRRSTARPGSSPLARGLLKSVAAKPINFRIIPARAGFTLWR